MKKIYSYLFVSLVWPITAGAIVYNVDLGGPNGNTFNPSSLTINVGDTVVWNNLGGFHNVNGTTITFPGNPMSFGNSSASAPWTYLFVFTTPGLYNYQCDPHAGLGMTGTVQVNATTSPSALNPGDIVFAGFQSDAPDGFAIIAMVDLPPNLEIKFTDRSWGPSSTNGGAFDWYSTTAEDTMVWTTPSTGVSAGTYVRFEDPSSGTDALIFGAGGSTQGSLSGISSSGDNIFCFLGDMSNPFFIGGIMTPRSNNINLTWLTSGLAVSTESYLPPPLIDGVDAFVFAPAHVDNGYYNCAVSMADTATLRAAIYNQSNWITDNDTAVAGASNWPACNLTFGSTSSLNAGDIVFAGFQSDAPDGFAIIAMVDLPPNLEIKFTDRSWGPSSTNGGAFDWYSTTAEDTMVWTTPSTGVSAGTYVRFEDPSSGTDALIFGAGGSTQGSLSGISSSGDNIFCFLGDMSNPFFIGGIMTPRSNNINLTWLTSGLAVSTESYLPPPLIDGVDAFVFAPAHVDNGYYNCAVSMADTATLRAAIYNQSNWITDNDTAVAGASNWPACNLTFAPTSSPSGVSFLSADQNVPESIGTLRLHLGIVPMASSNDTIIVTLTPGAGLDSLDGSTNPAYDALTGEIIIPVMAGMDSAHIDLTVVDDMLLEQNETATFKISYLSSGLTAGSDTVVVITIIDNDIVIPTYSIGAVTTNNADGEPDSNGVTCTLEGIVLGTNLRPSGLQFTVHDGSDGIGTFSSNPLNNYTVTEGDQVRITGEIGFFNGLTQMNLDSVILLSQGNPIPVPQVVTSLDESTESELVQINDLWLVDPTQWTGSGPGFNVDVTNGINTYQLRIDADVDLYSQPAPSDSFHVVGIGSQFDPSSPYDSGYQLLPRYSLDIIPIIGREEFEILPVRLYPNPVNDQLIIDASEPVSIRVWNTTGILMFEGDIRERTNLSTETWAAGLYLVEVQMGQTIGTRRIIKQ